MLGRVFVVAAALAIGQLFAAGSPDVVTIDTGRVSGTSTNGVRVFKGIPFAAPPVGPLRWKPPQPAAPWTGVRAADAFGNRCMQLPYPETSPYYNAAFNAQPVGEDCLSLNVWTAASAGEKRPVMVWLHGGAWTRGGGSSPTFEGTALARKGVVLVTTNYRLGVFGFFAHPALTAESPQHASGNYAILDQVAALQWVQRNIAAFGGDPARVTLFGESAGSWSVSAVQATPLARGLFRAAIGESGGQFAATPPLADIERAGVAFAKTAGAESLDALRAMPAAALAGIESFRPAVVIDGYALPDSVGHLFAQKKQNNVPVIVGSNADEMRTFGAGVPQMPKTLDEYRRRINALYGAGAAEYDRLYPVASEADIAPALLAVARDSVFTLEMRTWARLVTASGRDAFLYQFTRVPPGPNPAWGAYHAAELSYVFNNIGTRPWATDVDRRLSDQMSSYWVNFAITGDPNGSDRVRWRPYTEADEPYLEFGDTVQAKNHLLTAQLDFLESFRRRSTRSSR